MAIPIHSAVTRWSFLAMWDFLFAVIILIYLGCAPTTSSTPDSRPLLYLDLESGSSYSVSVEGRSLGVVVKAPSATWSPDGKRYAFVGDGEGLYVVNGHGQATIITMDSTEHLYPYPAWSPDGRSLAVIALSEPPGNTGPYLASVLVVDVEGRRIRARYTIPEGTIHLPSYFSGVDKLRWAPDGTKILLSWENAIMIDTRLGTIKTVSSTQSVAEWAPDSNAVYFFVVEKRKKEIPFSGFYLWKQDSAKAVLLADQKNFRGLGLRHNLGSPGRLLLSPSGSKLAFFTGSSGTHSAVYLYDIKVGSFVVLDKPSKSFQAEEWLVGIEWSPDENNLAALTINESTNQIKIKCLDLRTGKWNDLAKISTPLSNEAIDALGVVKALSWTQ